MESIAYAVFKVMFWVTLALALLGIIVAIIYDIYKYKDLQERLERHQNRKATKEKT